MVGDRIATVRCRRIRRRDGPLISSRGRCTEVERFTLLMLDHGITDDHTPLNEIGIPIIDLIDFDFPPWHTAKTRSTKSAPRAWKSLRRVVHVSIWAKLALSQMN